MASSPSAGGSCSIEATQCRAGARGSLPGNPQSQWEAGARVAGREGPGHLPAASHSRGSASTFPAKPSCVNRGWGERTQVRVKN